VLSQLKCPKIINFISLEKSCSLKLSSVSNYELSPYQTNYILHTRLIGKTCLVWYIEFYRSGVKNFGKGESESTSALAKILGTSNDDDYDLLDDRDIKEVKNFIFKCRSRQLKRC